jgi:phosphomannomutase
VACHVSAVGEANVVDAMLAAGAILGGEGNGGVIDPRVVLVRDSFVAMALVLERMCTASGTSHGRGNESITTIDSLARALPHLMMKKTKVDLSPELQGPALATAIDRIERAFPQARANRLDGLRLDWDGGWLLVRSSNTEPIVRIVAEAADATAVDEAIQRATEALLSKA